MKAIKKIGVFRLRKRANVSKDTIFLIKINVFLLQFFICNYWTAVQYTAGKSSLNGRTRHSIRQYMFIINIW